MENQAPLINSAKNPFVPQIHVDAKDRILLFVALVMGFLLFDFILFRGFGISLPIYIALFYACVFWYFAGKPGGIRKQGLPLLIPIALLSACFALYNNLLLSMLNFMLLYGLIMLQLATMSGNRLYKTFFLGLFLDSLHVGLVLPLANLPAPFKVMGSKQAASGKSNKIAPILIGLVLSLPVLALVLGLLSSADIVFERSLSGITSFINENIAEYIIKIIFGAFAAVPLFGALFALRNNKPITAMKVKVKPDKIRFMDASVANTVMVLLVAVYILFIAVQIGYLTNAFASILPQGFSYAEYARRGFFELMGVVFINLCVLAFSMLFSKRDHHVSATILKTLETMLVAATLVLIASALAKMAMYVDAYGLTLLRVYVTWFMVLCTVLFLALLVKMYYKTFALARFCCIAFLVLFIGLNYLSVDARIAQYNIANYQSGKFKTVDVHMFYSLSDSMVPYAAELLDNSDPAVAAKAREVLSERASTVEPQSWHVYNVATDQAHKVLDDKGVTYQRRPGYSGMD